MSKVQPYAPIDWALPLAWYCPAAGRLIEASLNDEYGGFATRLKETPEPAGSGTMLDNTLLLFGGTSVAIFQPLCRR